MNKKNLLQKMLKHFPRWMDIRKRTSKSNGGQLLESIAEEVLEIDQAIEEYKKDFFIDRYEGREDQIIAFLYKLPVGKIELKYLSLVSPKLEITNDLKTFHESSSMAYYENGYLFFKESDIENPTITFKIKGHEIKDTAEIMHVWNVFDEFAAFVGIERHFGETNKQLKERTVNVCKYPANSTAEGLKNAIKIELLDLVPDLDTDQIKIERPTPENLKKYYDEFHSILDVLAEINKDVYRTKEWDIDSWNYVFKSVDYIPHVWDAAIETFKNGIGFDEDLKISFATEQDTTDVDITFLKKSEAAIKEYVRKRDIEMDIDLKLTQYDNVLKPVAVDYRIEAEPAKDITSNTIALKCYDIIQGKQEVYVQKLVMNTSDSLKDIQVIDNRLLTPNKQYKVVLEPIEDYGQMRIMDCDIEHKNADGSISKEDLRKENPEYGFVFDPPFTQNELIYRNVELYASKKHEFTDAINMYSKSNGVSLEDLSKTGILKLNLDGLARQQMFIKHSCQQTTFNPSYATIDGFTVRPDGKIGSIEGADRRTVQYRLKANHIEIEIEQGFYNIQINSETLNENIFDFGKKIFTYDLDKPETISIMITATSTATVIVNHLKYTHYTIDLSLTEGSLSKLGAAMILPDISQNDLEIQVQTFTGYSPIIEYVHIGSPLTGIKYETDVFTTQDETRININTKNCKIKLINITDGTETNNYIPYCKYKALTDDAFIMLDLSVYANINKLETYTGRFDNIGTGVNKKYYLRLKTDEEVSTIFVDGNKLDTVKTLYLHNLLNVNPANGDKLFITSLFKDFIIKKNTGEEKVSLTYQMLGLETTSFELVGLPEDVIGGFVTGNDNNMYILNNNYSGRFKKVFLTPKNNTNHIAIMSKKLILSELDNVDFPSYAFNPLIPENKLMAYQITALDPKQVNGAKFENPTQKKDFALLNDWSLGHKKIRLKTSIDLKKEVSYDINKSETTKYKHRLGNTIPLPETITLDTGEIVRLSEYILTPPEGMNIVYNTKPYLATIEEASDYYVSEKLIIEEDGFNKLKHSNIDFIDYVGTTPWNQDESQTNPLSIEDYGLMNQEGIVYWNNHELVGQTIYIQYVIKKPAYIQVSMNELYNLIQYDVDAYIEMSTINLKGLKDQDLYDLKQHKAFNTSEKIAVKCSSAGFKATLNNGHIKIEKIAESNTVVVKTGYYYLDGQEYYLFSNQSKDQVDKSKYVEMFNVNREAGQMDFKKRSRNYVKNSKMDLSLMAKTYQNDFKNNPNIIGASALNSITACENFNHWNTFGVDLILVEGYNGQGIKLKPLLQNGYAYLDITDKLFDSTLITFFADKEIKAYIGKERKIQQYEFTQSVSIDIIKEIKTNDIFPDMRFFTFRADEQFHYYLIISGNGIIDDILIKNSQEPFDENIVHKKNIDLLNFKIEEQIQEDFEPRIYLTDNRGSKSDGAEVNAEGAIINSSLIDWEITKIKQYEKLDDWSQCQLDNIVAYKNYVTTRLNRAGSIMTKPIYIGDITTIKYLLFKINDVLFDNMTGFKTTVYVSTEYNGNYRKATTYSENTGIALGEQLMPYVKIKIDVPSMKIISKLELFLEHKTTDVSAPVAVPVNSGSFTSKILDAQYPKNYRIKNINIDSISNINDVKIEIRAARENPKEEVWFPWKTIELTDELKFQNDIQFENCRFFQVRVQLKVRDAFVKLNYIDLEVI